MKHCLVGWRLLCDEHIRRTEVALVQQGLEPCVCPLAGETNRTQNCDVQLSTLSHFIQEYNGGKGGCPSQSQKVGFQNIQLTAAVFGATIV
jgi:hypothetical protein